MKETGITKESVGLGFFLINNIVGQDTLRLELVFNENRKNNESNCQQLVFCNDEGITGIQQAFFILSTCFGRYSYDVSLVSEDGRTNSGIVLIPVIDLVRQNYYQVVIKVNNEKSVLGTGKFFYD